MFLTSAEVTLGVGILTAGSAIGATWLTSRRDRRNRELELEQERKRWEREDHQREAERSLTESMTLAELRHEDAARWIERRLELHTEFLTATKQVGEEFEEFETKWLYGPEDQRHVVLPMNLVHNHFDETISSLQLMATDAVVAAALSVREQAERVADACHLVTRHWIRDRKPPRSGGPEKQEMTAARQSYDDSIAAYILAVRRELGTISGRFESHDEGPQEPEVMSQR